jgi:hypothetical protein
VPFRVPEPLVGRGDLLVRAEATAGKFSKTWPSVADFVECTEVDGQGREPGSVLLWGSQGGVKCMLKDPGKKVVCFLFGVGLTEALDSAEKVLRTGEGDWRRDRPPTGRKK